MNCKAFQNLNSTGAPEVSITLPTTLVTHSLKLKVEGAVSNDYTDDSFAGFVGEEGEGPIAMPAITPTYDAVNDETNIPFVFETTIPQKGRYAIVWTPVGGSAKTLLTGEYRRLDSVLGDF